MVSAPFHTDIHELGPRDWTSGLFVSDRNLQPKILLDDSSIFIPKIGCLFVSLPPGPEIKYRVSHIHARLLLVVVFKWGAGFTFFQNCTYLLLFSHQSKICLWSRKDLAGEVNNGFRLGANGFGNPNVEESECASLSCFYLCAKPQKLLLVVIVF